MATSIKEAKRMAKMEKKRFKREKKASKKQRKLERKMRKVQRKGAKLERKLGQSPGAAPPEAKAEFETVADKPAEVPEFEVITAPVEEIEAVREVPDIPFDKGRIPEIERRMDYLIEGESGVLKRFKEKYGEEIQVPVGPQVRKGAPEQVAVPEVPETKAAMEEPVAKAEPAAAEAPKPTAEPKKEKKAKEKRVIEPGEPVPFLDFKRWKFIQSRHPPTNIVMTVVLSVIDLVLWIIRLIMGIPVMILKKILGMLKKKPKAEAAKD
ncbi:MAG: hypothetical protein L0Z54_00645 [Thermoplasmata archaeon]|nr:hypothetical protein [Thermoplasmata archaeon]